MKKFSHNGNTPPELNQQAAYKHQPSLGQELNALSLLILLLSPKTLHQSVTSLKLRL